MALIESDSSATMMLSHNIYNVTAKILLGKARPVGNPSFRFWAELTSNQKQKKARLLGHGGCLQVLHSCIK